MKQLKESIMSDNNVKKYIKESNQDPYKIRRSGTSEL